MATRLRIAPTTPYRNRSAARATEGPGRSSASRIFCSGYTKPSGRAALSSAGTRSARRPIGKSCFPPIRPGGISMTSWSSSLRYCRNSSRHAALPTPRRRAMRLTISWHPQSPPRSGAAAARWSPAAIATRFSSPRRRRRSSTRSRPAKWRASARQRSRRATGSRRDRCPISSRCAATRRMGSPAPAASAPRGRPRCCTNTQPWRTRSTTAISQRRPSNYGSTAVSRRWIRPRRCPPSRTSRPAGTRRPPWPATGSWGGWHSGSTNWGAAEPSPALRERGNRSGKRAVGEGIRFAASLPPHPTLSPDGGEGEVLACRLQLRDAGAGAVLILLRGAAADPAGAFDDAVAEDRYRALAHDHLATRGGRDAAWGRLVGARRHLAAGAAKRRRGDRLALAAIGARPDRVVHALQRDEAPAAVAHRGADLDVEISRLCQRAGKDAIGFFQCETHRFSPLVTRQFPLRPDYSEIGTDGPASAAKRGPTRGRMVGVMVSLPILVYLEALAPAARLVVVG